MLAWQSYPQKRAALPCELEVLQKIVHTLAVHPRQQSASIRISKQSGVIDHAQLHLHSVNPIPTGCCQVILIYGLIPPSAGRNRVKQQIHPRIRADCTTHSMLRL